MDLSFLKDLFDRRGAKFASYVLAFVSIFIVILLYLNQSHLLDTLELGAYDLRFSKLRGALTPHPDIALIVIDEKSVSELGQLPWKDDQYIRLLERLKLAGTRAILLDVAVPEFASARHVKVWQQLVGNSRNTGLAYELNKDKPVATAGFRNLQADQDGVDRRYRLFAETEGRRVPSLGLLAAMLAKGESEFEVVRNGVRVGDVYIPLDAERKMLVNYLGLPGLYPRFSFADVVRGQVQSGILQGKIVFVGVTAPPHAVNRATPFAQQMPDVEEIATVTDNILSERFISRNLLDIALDIALIILLGLLAFSLTRWLGFYVAIPASLLFCTVYLGFAYWMFKQGHWISMIYPSLVIFVSLLVCGSFSYLVLERGAREMRSIFSSYHSDKLVARLEQDPEAAQIGGDNKDVTIIFTDIRGFTAFSEQRLPKEVVTRLNEYLGEMVQIIEEYDGYVDKFIGDGIMAYWGAPLAQEDHANLAIACLLAMQDAMHKLQAKWQEAGEEPFAIRAGVQSGEVVAGNIGLHGKKMEYTVIGDTVNQAARLETSAKYYGVDMLVGEETYLRTQEVYGYRELDRVRMVGKKLPLTVYELIGPIAEQPGRLQKLFADALEIYRSQAWNAAEKAFSAIVREYPQDKPSAMYLERCQYFIQHPATSDWDGVFVRNAK